MIAFHCRACNQLGVETKFGNFGDLLEHIGQFHGDLYPNLAIAPLVLRRDLQRFVPKVEEKPCACICGCKQNCQGEKLCPACRTLVSYQAQFPLRFLIQRHG